PDPGVLRRPDPGSRPRGAARRLARLRAVRGDCPGGPGLSRRGPRTGRARAAALRQGGEAPRGGDRAVDHGPAVPGLRRLWPVVDPRPLVTEVLLETSTHACRFAPAPP